MHLLAYFMRCSLPRLTLSLKVISLMPQWGEASFKRDISSDRTPVQTVTEGLEQLQPGHGWGITAPSTSHNDSRRQRLRTKVIAHCCRWQSLNFFMGWLTARAQRRRCSQFIPGAAGGRNMKWSLANWRIYRRREVSTVRWAWLQSNGTVLPGLRLLSCSLRHEAIFEVDRLPWRRPSPRLLCPATSSSSLQLSNPDCLRVTAQVFSSRRC